MKAVKNIAVFFVIMFLLNITVSGLFAQTREMSRPEVKKDSATEQKTIKTEVDKIESFETPNAANTLINQSSSKSQIDERYRIGYQDTLDVQVVKHPELSLVVAINPDGTIFLPRIQQPIVAVCKTEGELKENITALYKNYLREPFVNVRAIDQKSQGFAVIGAVKKPGNFYLSRKVRLLELIALAGGYDVEFAGAKIKVARVGNVSGCRETAAVEDNTDEVLFLNYNLKDVIEGKQNPLMQPGDIVSVLEAEEVYVVGNVIKPTKIPIKESVTLTQAIAAALGLNSTAKTDKVVIQRQQSANSPKTELVFNLKDIRDKKIPDPILQANDIVDVGADRGKSVVKGFYKILTNGLPTVFNRVPLP